MDAIVFDIDGTLTDVDHRRHLLPDWKAFFEAMTDDPPAEDICWLAEELASWQEHADEAAGYTPFNIFLCSGRPVEYRPQTEAWLKKHVPGLWRQVEALLMRPSGDYRSDVIVKKEMLDGIRGQGYDVRIAFDDRQGVVDMWRANDVTCAQVAPGDFDSQKPQYEPGILTLMVGPSGAGKTTYVEGLHGDSPVLSSDHMRHLLCGDFRSQDKNAQVFDTLHAVARASVENGIHTIVDATNLRNKDRKRFLNWAPVSCKIEYLVIDRPLHVKRHDAGWRWNVRVKDKSLIQYHHDIFQSNLRDILAGDGDPRVVVTDLRPKECR